MPLRTPQNYQAPYTSRSLATHFAGSGAAAVACKIISPIDASVVAMTTWSSNLTSVPGYSGVTFRSTTGMTGSNVEAQPNRPTNMEADLFLVAAGITEADALAGKWSRAVTEVLLLNPEVVNMGQYLIKKGHLGQFIQRGQVITAEIMGLLDAITINHGYITRAECRHEFGDSGCTLDLSALGYIKTGTLTGVTSTTAFTDSGRSEADDYFGNGVFSFTSGNNNGYSFHIDAWNGTTKTWTLRTPTPYTPQVGDTYSAKRGCRKRIADCAGYSNAVNFGGDPYVPTVEDLGRLPLS